MTGYRILRLGVQAGTSATTTFTDTGLAASTQYSYTVQAYDAAGNVSAPSASASATTLPSSTRTCSNPVFVTSDPNGGWETNGYFVYNNMWNKVAGSSQTLYACAYNNWYVVSTQPDTTSVKTYPNVHKDFPNVPISSFNAISSSFAETSPHVGIYNVAYDIWLNGVASSGSTEVMLWNENFNQRPSGNPVTTATLGGRSYTVWKTSDSHYIALVPSSPFTSGTVDLLGVFQWIIWQGWMPASSTVGQIDFGVEICSTNNQPATFTFSDFSVSTS